MSNREENALSKAEGSLGLLSAAERPDAEELISLFKRLFSAPAEASPSERVRLLRLIEVLARRSSTAMPFAALGRALSARIAGDEGSAQRLLDEFETKLQMLGL